ncbi:MAG: AraC family transcriptional regulator ligand-binding domain-containing protein [Myxococcales bacterium]|nr:AraC family transcriptional regulator ligand-binding domain-containing protein [Myxococcales bacterium]
MGSAADSEHTGKAMEASGSTVGLMALTPFLRSLEAAGPEATLRAFERGEAILHRWGLSGEELANDPSLRLPHDLVIELQMDFLDLLDDPSASLLAGQRLQPGDYELLEYLCATCGTLGEAIACLGRYYPLLIDAEHTLAVEGGRAEARFRIRPGLQAPDAIHEFALASNFTMTILHMELEGAKPLIEVCVAHPAPPHHMLFPQVFLAPVRFGCEHNALVFPVAMLDQPMRQADPVLHAVLTRQADRELSALSTRSAFPAQVREVIEQLLPQGAGLEQVADRLHVSPSALRTRLKQYGTTYSDLLDELRREHARRALRQSRRSVSEIAHALGFANPPAFHRAFRRWFGVTPVAFRESALEHPAARFWRRPG